MVDPLAPAANGREWCSRPSSLASTCYPFQNPRLGSREGTWAAAGGIRAREVPPVAPASERVCATCFVGDGPGPSPATGSETTPGPKGGGSFSHAHRCLKFAESGPAPGRSVPGGGYMTVTAVTRPLRGRYAAVTRPLHDRTPYYVVHVRTTVLEARAWGPSDATDRRLPAPALARGSGHQPTNHSNPIWVGGRRPTDRLTRD